MLSVKVSDNMETSGCARGPEDAYRPHTGGDDRTPVFVFGRMPEGVENVAVVLTGDRVVPPSDVIAGPGGPLYVVELPKGKGVNSVVGSRPDGTTVRYEVPRPVDNRSGFDRVWQWVPVVLIVAFVARNSVVLLSRLRRARRKRA